MVSYQILLDAQQRPDLFHWFGALDKGVLDA
jgi:hypothetical protein